MNSTGIKGLDRILTGLRPGDNVVWQIDNIQDYEDLVTPFVRQAVREGRKIVYVRFASHSEVLKPSKSVKRYELNASVGFEAFTAKVNDIITREGEGAYYVFDCLTELLTAWAADLLIGNFFSVTCPYLYELKTVTYFAILRNNHSFKSIARIRETTQLLLDVYRCRSACYIHPLKVWNRYSPTMFLPHLRKKDTCVPVTDSVNASKILSYIHQKGVESVQRNLDYWDRLFLEAEELLKSKASVKKKKEMVSKLVSLMITKDKKVLSLVLRYLNLEDLLEIKSRLVGTGFVGGKTVGMLLARKILISNKTFDWQKISEPHDSFYIGSDIFYSYIVENHLWKLRLQQKTQDGYFEMAKILKEKMLYGIFSQEIMEYFQQIIEYFGSAPIIVRSSSLLEDSFGNAFAGKYESIFLANQGTPEQRYIQFAEAVKKIYASTMSEDALVYRKQRGLDKMDEQMALLVQRVSGANHGNYFFPDSAGVGVSHNIYVWNESMDSHAGMLRLVFGLGTRAVNRVEGDYPRMVALDEPLRRPYAEKDDFRKYSQHEVDVIDTKENVLKTILLQKLVDEKIYSGFSRIAVEDEEASRLMQDALVLDREFWVLTFDRLFENHAFAVTFKKILKILEVAYDYPVEIEFTMNFTQSNSFKINLLQCRPLQIGAKDARGQKSLLPKAFEAKNVFFESHGYFLGGNISQKIYKIIFVDPKRYSELSLSDKYEIAHLVGKLNAGVKSREAEPILLIGPGRWGTTTPSLGVPVKFAEINHVAVLAEVAFTAGNLMPELSFGTHFFQDLVETGIFYVALFPDNKEVNFQIKRLLEFKNSLTELLPQAEKFKDVFFVYDVKSAGLKIVSDIVTQKVVCLFCEK